MIFITGPLYAGKQEYICNALGWSEEDFKKRAVRDVQTLAAETQNLEALASELSTYEVVLATEVGGGIVPTDSGERVNREKAGKLSCLLAGRADTVIRVCCGLPQVLKGRLP